MNNHQSKLYAFLVEVGFPYDQIRALACLAEVLPEAPPGCFYQKAADVARASDRLLFQQQSLEQTSKPVRHLISGQEQTIPLVEENIPEIPSFIRQETEAQTVFLWFWRFYAELQSQQQPNTLLNPADPILPDCPRHSYASTVSALVTTMPPAVESPKPYLLLFTFSPIQEFIKASRKFLDFWAGSYLLHYLSADLCWYIAQHHGPDMVITPSLWSQEIIDALILKQHPEWADSFRAIQRGTTPVERFEQKQSSSLSTAGFPNTITVLAASKAEALELGQALAKRLKDCWQEISQNVRKAIKDQVREKLEDAKIYADIQAEINKEFNPADIDLCIRELAQYKQHSCWEWNSLWDAQIDHTWEPYYVAVPLGHPDPNQPLQIEHSDSALENWITAQNAIVQPRVPIPAPAEREAYETLNVGSWWGNYQGRLGQLIQAVKNTRTWQIAAAPGERSSLSGQHSAVHPRFNYSKFPNGRGMTAASMRLFWLVMKYAFPGAFNGTEKLNAIELTKRMAWKEGGVAEKLALVLKGDVQDDDQEEGDNYNYENLIRFPNLSSIAAARFATDHPAQARHYRSILNKAIQRNLPQKRDAFGKLTRHPFQVRRADAALNPGQRDGQDYNGVMFSSKWLADDLGLTNDAELTTLRQLVDQAHQQTGFGDSSPADWWVLIMGDGDGMGQYVSGGKLHNYSEYVIRDAINESCFSPGTLNALLASRKRMGPATHVGLNRALLDFSNRLVPYLTEQRFCGRVVYSGGDDVMVMLPLADLPNFLRSLRAAWSGASDPQKEFHAEGGYWHPSALSLQEKGIPKRPLFTMGKGATMSLGIVIAHKSIPLPTVLEKLWEAEKDRAKKMQGGLDQHNQMVPAKDGLCFRIVYGSGNTLEALMKGHLLESWWQMLNSYEAETETPKDALAPVLYRLAEELPRHVDVTANYRLCSLAAQVITSSRDQKLPDATSKALEQWLNEWEAWAWVAQQTKQQELTKQGKTLKEAEEEAKANTLGASPKDLGYLLRFTAFWVSRREQEQSWTKNRSTGGVA